MVRGLKKKRIEKEGRGKQGSPPPPQSWYATWAERSWGNRTAEEAKAASAAAEEEEWKQSRDRESRGRLDMSAAFEKRGVGVRTHKLFRVLAWRLDFPEIKLNFPWDWFREKANLRRHWLWFRRNIVYTRWWCSCLAIYQSIGSREASDTAFGSLAAN